jgi:hypothetical protein
MFLRPNSIRAGRTAGVLLFVLALVVAAIALAWITAASRGQVTTYLKIPRHAGSIIDDAGPEPWDEYLRRRDDYKTLIVTPLVMEAALQQQDIANLDLTRRHYSSPLRLANAITVAFPTDGEIMQVSMQSSRRDAPQATMILDAVVKAFQEKVLLQQRLVKASYQADFRSAVADVKKRHEAQLEELHQLQHADPPVNAPTISALEVRCELEGKLLAELELKLLKAELLNNIDERAERQGGMAHGGAEVYQPATFEDR